MAFISRITASLGQIKDRFIPHLTSSKVTRGQSFTHDFVNVQNKNNLLHDFSLELSQNTDLNEVLDNDKQEKDNRFSILA